VLIHGWALDLGMWAPQVAALTPRFRVIRMDRRGFGASRAAPSLVEDVKAIAELIERLDLQNVVLVGMSQGARVALALAECLSPRIVRLVLDGAPWEGEEQLDTEPELPLDQYRAVLEQQGIEALRVKLRQHPFVKLHRPSASSHALVQRMISRYAARDLGVPAVRLMHRLECIQVPTLVMNGEFDSPSRCAMGDALCAKLPNARRAIVRDAGHLANLDNPGEYNEILTRFVESPPA
jgi:pimeloyl-ACP methyl ester carboxylesterase